MSPNSERISTIQDYLEQLRRELAASDPALIQDALYDAEEYLRNESAAHGGSSDPEALRQAFDRFGTPAEVAEAYRETDARVSAALTPPAPVDLGEGIERLFRIFLEPRSYGALLYMLLALPTGVLYFTWAVTGLSLSLGLSVLIIGLPFFLAFLASIRLFALLEGRMVESLLAVRMPRRPPLATRQGSMWTRLGSWLQDRRTWTTLLYMVLKLPLGVASFTIFTVLLSLALALLASPIAQSVFGIPMVQVRDHQYFLPIWLYPFCWAAAGVDLILILHLARVLGRLQGALAKAMLVRA
jgi:hypothetical protein